MVGARLEKVQQAWHRVNPHLPWVLGGLIVLAGFILALYYIPKMQVPVCPPGKEGLPPKICFDIENEARRTVAYIEGGLLAIIGIILTFRRIRALERQVLVAQEGQITERFTRAIEQLGSDRMEVRLGGIYALERIANDSDKDYWPIIETLSAFVRERAPWQEPPPGSKGGASESEALEESGSDVEEPEIEPATDIQAVLTVLGRRRYHYGQGENQRLDLRSTDLRGADFWAARLEGASLVAAHLEGATLWNAHLEWAELWGAHLEGTLLGGAHLDRGTLWRAHLEGAVLRGGHLEGTTLWEATGITREQLAEAIIDEKTILPDYLQEKRPEALGPERTSED